MADEGFETVAVVYSLPEAAVMQSMFAFYDIPVQMVGLGHAATQPPWTVMLGGITVRVAAEAAAEARALLADVATRPAAVRPRLIDPPWLNAVLVVLACVLLAFPVPPTRTSSTFFLDDR